MIKALLLVILALIITTIGLGCWSKHLNNKLDKANKDNILLTSAVDNYVKTLDLMKSTSKISEDVVSKVLQTKQKDEQTKVAIIDHINKINKQVSNEQITTDVANAAYIDSMWDAYCTANQNRGACSRRQPSH